jgi:hypothetical protein
VAVGGLPPFFFPFCGSCVWTCVLAHVRMLFQYGASLHSRYLLYYDYFTAFPRLQRVTFLALDECMIVYDTYICIIVLYA